MRKKLGGLLIAVALALGVLFAPSGDAPPPAPAGIAVAPGRIATVTTGGIVVTDRIHTASISTEYRAQACEVSESWNNGTQRSWVSATTTPATSPPE